LQLLKDAVRVRTRELREANRALRASLTEVRHLRRYSDQVIASLASSLVTFDREGRVTTVNPPARVLLQLGRVPAAGLQLSDLFGAAFAGSLLAKLGKRAVHITRVQGPVRLCTGEEKVVGYSVTPLLLPRGGNGWIMLFRDITD
jgi:nitrogen fixation/metabolism regulation signal transduction histidine kinase